MPYILPQIHLDLHILSPATTNLTYDVHGLGWLVAAHLLSWGMCCVLSVVCFYIIIGFKAHMTHDILNVMKQDIFPFLQFVTIYGKFHPAIRMIISWPLFSGAHYFRLFLLDFWLICLLWSSSFLFAGDDLAATCLLPWFTGWWFFYPLIFFCPCVSSVLTFKLDAFSSELAAAAVLFL